MQFELLQILLNSDDRYSIPRRDTIHRSQKVKNLVNEKLTPLRTKPPRLVQNRLSSILLHLLWEKVFIIYKFPKNTKSDLVFELLRMWLERHRFKSRRRHVFLRDVILRWRTKLKPFLLQQSLINKTRCSYHLLYYFTKI